MKENFLVTRPVLQSEEVAGCLRQNGFEVLLEPICTVKVVKYTKKELEELKKELILAVFLTSFNATEAFLEFELDKNVAIFAIGEKTVRKIRENGYKNIFLPEKSNILELERLFLRQNLSKDGKILYFCGNYLTKDLKLSLGESGFVVKNILSYEIKYHEEFSLRFLELVRKKKIDNVLCYSRNNVKHLFELVKRHGLRDFFVEANLVVISDEVASEAKNLGFKKVRLFSDYEFLII